MFKIAFVTILILAFANGRPQNSAAPPPANAAASAGGAHAAPSGNITILKNDRTPLDDKGSYSYDIELSDGTKLIQMGNTEAPAAGENETSIVIKGSYSYIAPDGTPVNVMYIANKDGFQPTGDVIPKDKNSAAAAASPASAAPLAASAAASAVPPPAAAPSASAPVAPVAPAPVAAAPAAVPL